MGADTTLEGEASKSKILNQGINKMELRLRMIK